MTTSEKTKNRIIFITSTATRLALDIKPRTKNPSFFRKHLFPLPHVKFIPILSKTIFPMKRCYVQDKIKMEVTDFVKVKTFVKKFLSQNSKAI